MVFGIVIAASMLSLVFRGFGGDHTVERLLADMPGGTTGALALVMVLVFFLGFMLEAVEIIYISCHYSGRQFWEPTYRRSGSECCWQ